jgi:hypothetical protein
MSYARLSDEPRAEALRAALNLTHGLKKPTDDGFIRGVLQSVGAYEL